MRRARLGRGGWEHGAAAGNPHQTPRAHTHTPLCSFEAVQNDDAEVFAVLCRPGFAPATNPLGQTPLTFACMVCVGEGRPRPNLAPLPPTPISRLHFLHAHTRAHSTPARRGSAAVAHVFVQKFPGLLKSLAPQKDCFGLCAKYYAARHAHMAGVCAKL